MHVTYNEDPREYSAVGFRHSLQQLTVFVATCFFVDGSDLTAQLNHILEEGLQVVLVGWFLILGGTTNGGLESLKSFFEQSTLGTTD